MTNFLNYAVSSHGRIVDHDFIIGMFNLQADTLLYILFVYIYTLFFT